MLNQSSKKEIELNLKTKIKGSEKENEKEAILYLGIALFLASISNFNCKIDKTSSEKKSFKDSILESIFAIKEFVIKNEKVILILFVISLFFISKRDYENIYKIIILIFGFVLNRYLH